MCWIFAYNWKKNCVPLLVEWLRNLEYRGYDSAWVFAYSSSSKSYLEKEIWKVSNLQKKIKDNYANSKKEAQIFNTWIAHTRWATHGKVTIENTHPHYSQNKRFFVVHNGIIENYSELKKSLEKKYKFYSDTDSEVIAKLIEDRFEVDLATTIERVCSLLVGAYAIVAIDKRKPNTLVGAKIWSPMIVWTWKDWVFIGSDINAISKFCKKFYQIEDWEIVVVKNEKLEVFSSGEKITKDSLEIWKNFEVANKWDFPTFTEKEIHEVSLVLKNVFKWRIDFKEKTITNETLKKLNNFDIKQIEIIASGSSYFAGQVWANWFKSLAWIKTETRISSEFLYDTFLPDKKTLYIFLSQSWETADVRECVKMVKNSSSITFWIVNVVASTIARMCDMGLYSHSWIEVWVASTKNIVWQYWVLLLMALSMGLQRNLEYSKARTIIEDLQELPKKIETCFKQENKIKKLAKKYSKYKNLFFLWRNTLYPVACEWSLKLKELSYLHSEAYSTWELKHWPLALIQDDLPTIVLNLKWVLTEKTESNIKEIKARNGKVLWFISEDDKNKNLYDDYIELPSTNKHLIPFIPLAPIWIFAVEVAKCLNKNIDKPQNLAKSVTVE